MLETLLSDLRFSWRSLRKSPLFTTLTLLTLMLGIGANSAIFSVIHSVLLKPLPYPHPDRIVAIWNHYQDKAQATLAGPEFYSYKQLTSSFDSMAAFGTGQVNLTGSGNPIRISAVSASDEIFRVLGLTTHLGRVFTAAEDRPGANDVAVLSYESWQRNFGGDTRILGSSIQLDGTAFQVIGILQPQAHLPSDHQTGVQTDVWVPLGIDPANPGSWGFHGLRAWARLKPGLTLSRAEEDLDRAVETIRQEMPSQKDAISLPDFGADLWPMHEQIVGRTQNALLVIFGAVLGVLLVACANVANMLLARTETRLREISLRSALGASRQRLFRQFLTESLALTLLGGFLGAIFCNLCVHLLKAWNPGNLPRIQEIEVDSTVLLATLAVVGVASLIFGLTPTLHVGGNRLMDGLKVSNRVSGGRNTNRLRTTLVIAQLTLAIVLVSAATLFLRSFWNLQQEDLGFDTSSVLTFNLELPGSDYPDQVRVSSFVHELRRRLAQLPGVQAVGAVTGLPLSGRTGDWNFYYEGHELPDDASSPKGDWQVVTPGYFESLQVPVLRGRTFRESDDTGSELVVVINRALAQEYWPGENPLGNRIRMGGNDNNPFISIVGIVGDMRYRAVSDLPRPQIYLPLDQASRSLGIGPRRSLSLTLRTGADPVTLIGSIRSALQQLDPALPLSNVQTLETIRNRSLGDSRFSAGLLAGFAILALLLGAVGIYGVISYLVARRLPEMGIRLALGARPLEVVSLILGQGLRMALLALPIGLFLAIVSGRVVASLLYQVQAFDAIVFGAIATSLLLVALAACYVPARQASRVDPAKILRS